MRLIWTSDERQAKKHLISGFLSFTLMYLLGIIFVYFLIWLATN